MAEEAAEIYIGKSRLFDEQRPITGDIVDLHGEAYYRISHYDQMPPFFMSVVSGADHWLFVASTGGLTAGRINPESALFPYETEDKITAHHELTGSKIMLRVTRNGRTYLWEPFSIRFAGLHAIERHLYKNIHGNKLIFEEVNHDLQLTVRYSWRTSDRFGFVKSGWLQNDGGNACHIQLLDGLQNVLPYGASVQLQTTMSSLLNGYKRNELEPETGLGIFALSATLTDQAEPSESLKATVAWQVGLTPMCHLLSSQQVDDFRYGRALTPEQDICGKAGSYFVASQFELMPGTPKQWHIVADVNQDSAALIALINFLKQDQNSITTHIEEDIDQGTTNLVRFVAGADGLQRSAQEKTVAHHYANVLFNIMRGGIFADGYQIERKDFLDFLHIRNRHVLRAQDTWFEKLPQRMDIRELYALAADCGDSNLIRLCYEYLPLTFSRRHGDPSRPWNHFSINLKKADGSKNLDYEGNWRDIFQNWEPLAFSFPTFTVAMIAKFLNATTADGYNPYRLMRAGIEWEVPEPDNPWANIGYWSDHQIIYLQKLLEIAEQVQPGSLAQLWHQPIFAYANVPYRLRTYEEMLADWYNTIDFNWQSEEAIKKAVSQMGTDGRLLRDDEGNVIHVTMMEKLLVLLLAKLTNLVPEGGIWMNTQRPEWNDANNALVGKGLSVVTAAYLRRFIAFWQDQLVEQNGRGHTAQAFAVNSAVAKLFNQVQAIFVEFQKCLTEGFTVGDRREMMDALGTAVSAYRDRIYTGGIPHEQTKISEEELSAFLSLAQTFIDQTLRVNRRADGLAHTYNILQLEKEGVAIENLYLMLEGQVAYLSSGLLSSDEALALLQSLRQSDLYRPDQHSYMLYPNRRLPGFLQKNNVVAAQVAGSKLVAALATAGDTRLIKQDVAGDFHFNGRFRNVKNVIEVLDELGQEPPYSKLVANERDFILHLFELTFNHRAFTGRSGTFFAYEGLGSVYWHMVSKLLLAAQECYQQAVDEGAGTVVTDALAAAYYDIRAGIGFNKSPEDFGAFPVDPYSHTPMSGRARQPGMTGQVKEEILTRRGELGVTLQDGMLCFAPTMLRTNELFQMEKDFEYVDVAGEAATLSLPSDSLVFTICQVPVVYLRGNQRQIEIVYADGRSETLAGSCLDRLKTQHIFKRDGQVRQLVVTVTMGFS